MADCEKGKQMGEYISRKAAIGAIMSETTDAHYPSWYADKIKQIPAADVAAVVRCSDCIGKSTWYNCEEYGFAICGMSGMYPKSEHDYCSYGEREQNVQTD